MFISFSLAYCSEVLKQKPFEIHVVNKKMFEIYK